MFTIKTAKNTWLGGSIKVALVTLLMGGGIGCGILIGNVRPVEERSQSYSFSYTGATPGSWVTVSNLDGRRPTPDQPDYLIRKNGNISTIATASRCRGSSIDQGWFGLDALGLEEVHLEQKQKRRLVSYNAVQRDAVGQLDETQLKLRTVEFERAGCEYRFLFFAERDAFERDSQEFESFLNSLQFK